MPSTIPPEFEQFVKHELTTGRYQSAEEVITDALRLLRDRKLYELRKEIRAGLEQLDRGAGIDIADEQALHEFFEDIKRRGRQRLQAKQAGNESV
jgi:antitoxin ParD1/3/4